MAAFKRYDRPDEGYRIWVSLPDPWGRVGPWQTGVRTKRQAQAVEAWLKEMARTKPALIDGLVARTFGRRGLQKAWIAHLQGRLEDFLLQANDPLLSAAAKNYSEQTKDARVREGLLELSDLADAVLARRAEAGGEAAPKPGTVRLSWLLTAANVSELYREAERDRAPNSVKRSIHRAVSELLAHHFGKARKTVLMVDVQKPGEDDVRKVWVSREEIARVLEECDDEFRDLPQLAMLLGVDQQPLLRITPRAFRIWEVETDDGPLEVGTLEIVDLKTKSRWRTLELPAAAITILRRRVIGLGPDDRLWTYTKDQVRHRWEAARDRAAGVVVTRNRRDRGAVDPVRAEAERRLQEEGVVTLPVLRFKDLRHLLPTAWNALRLPAEDLPGIMGWAPGSDMPARYTTARIIGDRKHLDQTAEFWGLGRPHLRAAGE